MTADVHVPRNLATAIQVFLRALRLGLVPRCERCGCCHADGDDALDWEHPGTAREPWWDGRSSREHATLAESWWSNRPLLLCRVCARDHHDEMAERWREYHAGLL